VETGEERSVVMRAKDQTVLPENRHINYSAISAHELCGIAYRFNVEVSSDVRRKYK
jgi:hypothetical protein